MQDILEIVEGLRRFMDMTEGRTIGIVGEAGYEIIGPHYYY